MGVYGLGFGGCRVLGLGFRAWGFGLRVFGVWVFGVWGFWGLGFRVFWV